MSAGRRELHTAGVMVPRGTRPTKGQRREILRDRRARRTLAQLEANAAQAGI